MSEKYEDHIRLPQSLSLLLGKLSKAAVNRAFDAVRKETGSVTKQRLVREATPGRSPGSEVLWSLWIGHRTEPPSWYSGTDIEDKRHAFVLVLEHDGFVALASSMAGSVHKHLRLEVPTYSSLLAMKDLGAVEFSELRARNLTTAQAGILGTVTFGRELEKTMSRAMARRAVPDSLKFEDGVARWRLTPRTGRVGMLGGRVAIRDLCKFFSDLVTAIQNPPERTPGFVDAYAKPQDFGEVGSTIEPIALRFEAAVIEAHLEGQLVVRRGENPIQDQEVEDLFELLSSTLKLDRIDNSDPPKWQITHNTNKIGHLTKRKTKFSLFSDYLDEYTVEDPDGGGGATPLKRLFNDGDLPYIVSFDEPQHLYYLNRLFQDDRLIKEAELLVRILEPDLPKPGMREKTTTDGEDGFHLDSLFGFVEDQANDADFLICDDYGAEFADYISIHAAQVRFWHCKSGSAAAGASGLHEVVSQAVKNLGYLQASRAEYERRASARWGKPWCNKPGIPRLRNGGDVDGAVDALVKAASTVNYRPEVVLVVSGLKKSNVKDAFERMSAGKAAVAHHTQLLWLLSMFVDCCRSANARARVVCEP